MSEYQMPSRNDDFDLDIRLGADKDTFSPPYTEDPTGDDTCPNTCFNTCEVTCLQTCGDTCGLTCTPTCAGGICS